MRECSRDVERQRLGNFRTYTVNCAYAYIYHHVAHSHLVIYLSSFPRTTDFYFFTSCHSSVFLSSFYFDSKSSWKKTYAFILHRPTNLKRKRGRQYVVPVRSALRNIIRFLRLVGVSNEPPEYARM